MVVNINYDVKHCMCVCEQAGRGRGVVARGRAGGPPVRGAAAANRAGRGGAAAGVRGAARAPARGATRAKGSLQGQYLAMPV